MSDRLDKIQLELQQILDEKIGALHEKVRAIHTLSRELTMVESELTRQTLLHEELTAELAESAGELQKKVKKNESLEDKLEAANND